MAKKDEKYDVITVDEKDIPEIVTSQFTQLKTLETKVNESLDSAQKAQIAAENAHEKSASFGHKKEAIIHLQDAVLDLGQSQVLGAEAQKLSFIYQEQLAKITQYLFALGASNIAANRSVVRELEMKLNGASKEELSDFARQELINVVKQLKAQEDIMNKQTVLSSRVKEHDLKLKEHEKIGIILGERIDSTEQAIDESDRRLSEYETRQDKKLREHDEKLKAREEKDEEHDLLLKAGRDKDAEHEKLLSVQAEKDKEHDRLLKIREEKDIEHDRLLSEQVKKDYEHDRLLKAGAEKDIEHDKLLAVQIEKDKEHDRILHETAKKDQNQDFLIEQLVSRVGELEDTINEIKLNKCGAKIVYITLVIAAFGLLLSVLNFFI